MLTLHTLWTSEPVAFQSDAAERETIAAAKAGDDTAREAIVSAYLPALRNAVARRGLTSLDIEEVRQAAILGLFEAVAAYDPAAHPSLAGLVRQSVAGALSALSDGQQGQSVPERTREKFHHALAAAHGDPEAAAAALASEAPSRDRISPGTFWEVYRSHSVATFSGALANPDARDDTDDDDGLETARATRKGTDHGARPEDRVIATEAEALTRIAAAAALATLDARELAVVRLTYGLDGTAPKSSREIAPVLGVGYVTVTRTLNSALGKMRQSLHAS